MMLHIEIVHASGRGVWGCRTPRALLIGTAPLLAKSRNLNKVTGDRQKPRRMCSLVSGAAFEDSVRLIALLPLTINSSTKVHI
jgi:hypothetical protein